MAYSVEYFNRRVREEIESWPVGILADYARLIELLLEFGPCDRVEPKVSVERSTATSRGSA